MTDLLTRLETEEGSRELSAAILGLVRNVGEYDGIDLVPTRDSHIGLVDFRLKGALLVTYQEVPYTTSLDAKLPWEDDGYWEICGPRQYLNIPSPVPNYWSAEFTFGDAPPYKTVKAWAKTEVLARRAAALRARG